MKVLSKLFLLSLMISFVACSTSEQTAHDDPAAFGKSVQLENVRPDGAISDDRDYYRDLGDYLQRVPGILISGNRAMIRGINSFQSEIEPLFVLDGNVLGSSFAQANSFINVRDIDYVKVLKGPEAASYGVRGGNGVILIVTKR